MKHEVLHTDKAPAAIGPYSQGIKAGNMYFFSGQIPVNPETGEIVEGGVQEQAKQSLKNVKAVLENAGLGLENVVKTTVFIQNMGDFGAINEIYADVFGENKPARSCVEVAKIPKDALLEIEVIAIG